MLPEQQACADSLGRITKLSLDDAQCQAMFGIRHLVKRPVRIKGFGEVTDTHTLHATHRGKIRMDRDGRLSMGSPLDIASPNSNSEILSSCAGGAQSGEPADSAPELPEDVDVSSDLTRVDSFAEQA